MLLLTYSPVAYWGKDSFSFFNFAFDLRAEGSWDLDPKRRYIYPIFLLPVSFLPGGLLQWVAWIQHGLGVVTVLPLAYMVRRTLPQWRVTLIPITLFYAGLPLLFWYEHQVQADSLFIVTAAWMIGGWSAWASQTDRARACMLWWWWFVPFALLVLSKPAARFLWPGVVLALVLVCAWRVLRMRHWVALAALFAAGLTVGADGQGARLLYTSAFPLTRLDTPLHAEYKREIADMVKPLRQHLDAYYTLANEDFLKSPHRFPERPLWAALEEDDEKREKIYRELALEAIASRPDLFLYIGFQRLLASVNPGKVKQDRLGADFHAMRFKERYEDIVSEEPTLLSFLFGGIERGSVPNREELLQRVAPPRREWADGALERYVDAFHRAALVFHEPEGEEEEERPATEFRPTWIGWWLLAGLLLTVMPAYRRTLGAMALVMLGYGFAVFLVGSSGPRYFAPAWPMVTVLLAVPADFLIVRIRGLLRTRQHIKS